MLTVLALGASYGSLEAAGDDCASGDGVRVVDKH